MHKLLQSITYCWTNKQKTKIKESECQDTCTETEPGGINGFSGALNPLHNHQRQRCREADFWARLCCSTSPTHAGCDSLNATDFTSKWIRNCNCWAGLGSQWLPWGLQSSQECSSKLDTTRRLAYHAQTSSFLFSPPHDPSKKKEAHNQW